MTLSYTDPRLFRITFLLASCLILPSASAEVLLQSDSRERFGEKPFSYFFIEAEDFEDNDPRGAGEAWLLSSDDYALGFSAHPEFEPDPGRYASGGESITNTIQSLVTNDTGGGHDLQYRLIFDTPGDYYLYIRQHSPLGPNNDRNKHDSFYTPIEFGEDPIQNKVNGDDYGYLESIEFEGDVQQRGPWIWFAAREFVENSEQHPLSEQNDATFNVFGIRTSDVGDEMILELDHRESGTMIDALLFISVDSGLPPTNGEGPDGLGFFGLEDEIDAEFGLMNLGMGTAGDFNENGEIDLEDIDILTEQSASGAHLPQYDLTGDGFVNEADVNMWAKDKEIGYTWIGDANYDGQFNTGDFVQVLGGGKYEDANSTAVWSEGDWNGDGVFGTGDLVAALGDGGYELGPRTDVAAVPEPASSLFALIAALGLWIRFGRRR